MIEIGAADLAKAPWVDADGKSDGTGACDSTACYQRKTRVQRNNYALQTTAPTPMSSLVRTSWQLLPGRAAVESTEACVGWY
jgi:hypothetical protein